VPARGGHEWAAILLLLLGGFVFYVGWIAGLVLLWSSRVWTTREKLVGTLVVPGGLAAGFMALVIWLGRSIGPCNPGGCSGPSSGTLIALALIVLLGVVAPIATSIFLARRAGAASDR
jgi:hypothetical protein